MKKLKEFKPLIRLVKKDIKRIIFASIIIFLSGISEIFTGYLNGRIVETITKLEIKQSLIYLAIYFLLELMLDGIVIHKANSILYKEESKLTRKLGFETYKKALNLPAVAYEKNSSGEIINRITNDADTLSFSFGRLLKMVSSLIASFIIIIYIFVNSWIVGMEILIIVLILLLIVKKYSPISKEIHKERKKEQDRFTSLTNESIRGIREIKTLGIKKNLINSVTEIIKNIYKKSEDEINIQKSLNMKTSFLKTILECGVFATCIILLYYNKTSLTFFVAMTYYIYRYTWLIEEINDFTQTYQKVNVSLSRVNDILENRLYKDETFGSKELPNIKGIIEFKNVTFSYPDEENILKNFNIKIEPNKKIAIVGASGQGKSTIFNLLTRIFDANEGEILIDNINIKDLKEDELRKHISIIRQEPFVFNRTIKENFELINENITLKQIRKCTKMAYLDDYIMSLPKKYDTILGEGGVNLSGGQKQRLSIARTLSKESKIILFDEATSALDNNSQEYIKKTIDNLIKDHTIIIVAHRLSTIIDADIIYVVEKGKLLASGTHKELLKTNKIYKNLYETESLNS
ncbi:aBC-type multidrug transport system ATPase and permease component [Firmicutes bacterium CAG:884]|nr:aBC-type multidrug transport system ATPase and permease component [Firmicutes bacterium CAG:884]